MATHLEHAREHDYAPHNFDYSRSPMAGTPIRECSECGTRETYWDDDEYPVNPCPAACDCQDFGFDAQDLELHAPTCRIRSFDGAIGPHLR